MSMRVTSDTGPFAIIPEWVLDADIPDRAKTLFAVLSRYADGDGHAYPNRATLAGRLRCSEDSIDRAVVELVKADAVTVTRRVKNGDGQVRDGVPSPGWEATSTLYLIHRVPATVRVRPRVDAYTGPRVDADRTRAMFEREPPLPPIRNSNGAAPDLGGRGNQTLELMIRLEREHTTDVRDERAWTTRVRANLAERYGAEIRRVCDEYPDAPVAVVAGYVRGESTSIRYYDRVPAT